jgi:hypothetical protein
MQRRNDLRKWRRWRWRRHERRRRFLRCIERPFVRQLQLRHFQLRRIGLRHWQLRYWQLQLRRLGNRKFRLEQFRGRQLGFEQLGIRRLRRWLLHHDRRLFDWSDLWLSDRERLRGARQLLSRTGRHLPCVLGRLRMRRYRDQRHVHRSAQRIRDQTAASHGGVLLAGRCGGRMHERLAVPRWPEVLLPVRCRGLHEHVHHPAGQRNLSDVSVSSAPVSRVASPGV